MTFPAGNMTYVSPPVSHPPSLSNKTAPSPPHSLFLFLSLCLSLYLSLPTARGHSTAVLPTICNICVQAVNLRDNDQTKMQLLPFTSNESLNDIQKIDNILNISFINLTSNEKPIRRNRLRHIVV